MTIAMRSHFPIVKIKLPLKLLASMLLLAVYLRPSALHAQGALTPPGSPMPTMKTLGQIEPRMPISSAPFTIAQPGSYYLTTNVTVNSGHAISILANGVTVDLNGFTISSTEASPAGWGIIFQSGAEDIIVVNGHIKGGVTSNGGVYTGPGFANGIGFSGAIPHNVRVSGVSVSGCLYSGIYLNSTNSTVVESCTVQTVGGYGIFASVVSHSTANVCGLTAIYADKASDCFGWCIGNGNGFSVISANNCAGHSSYGVGLSASETATGCSGHCYGNNDGLAAASAASCFGSSAGNGSGLNTTIANSCYGQSSGGPGLYAETANNCYGYSSSGPGLYAVSVACGCSGYSAGNSPGLSAFIASVSHGSSVGGTALVAPHSINSY